NAFYAYRTGAAEITGLATGIGVGCLGSNGTLVQKIGPAPFLGRTSVFAVSGGPVLGAGMWLIGVPSPTFVFPGTKCGVYVQPALSLGIAFDKVGGFQFQSAVPNQRALIGSKMRTQF